MLKCGDFKINIGYPLWFLTTFGLLMTHGAFVLRTITEDRCSVYVPTTYLSLCIGEAIVIYVKALQNLEALYGVSRAAPLTVYVTEPCLHVRGH